MNSWSTQLLQAPSFTCITKLFLLRAPLQAITFTSFLHTSSVSSRYLEHVLTQSYTVQYQFDSCLFVNAQLAWPYEVFHPILLIVLQKVWKNYHICLLPQIYILFLQATFVKPLSHKLNKVERIFTTWISWLILQVWITNSTKIYLKVSLLHHSTLLPVFYAFCRTYCQT